MTEVRRGCHPERSEGGSPRVAMMCAGRSGWVTRREGCGVSSRPSTRRPRVSHAAEIAPPARHAVHHAPASLQSADRDRLSRVGPAVRAIPSASASGRDGCAGGAGLPGAPGGAAAVVPEQHQPGAGGLASSVCRGAAAAARGAGAVAAGQAARAVAGGPHSRRGAPGAAGAGRGGARDRGGAPWQRDAPHRVPHAASEDVDLERGEFRR